MAFYPYLFFPGNCREAMTRYQEVFGGDLDLVTGADMPAEESPGPDAADLIMHASLYFGDNVLMASDDPSGSVGRPDGFRVTFSTKDQAEARRVFEQLSADGEVAAPLATTSFSPAFGMCQDRFGVPWMIMADQDTD